MLACIALLLIPARVTIYVSTRGSDKWSGRYAAPTKNHQDGPLATIEGARDHARNISPDTPVTVIIESGTYRIRTPITFGPGDSGRERLYEGKSNVVISGLARLGRWRKLSNGYLQTTLPEVTRDGWNFSQLFVNGERRYRPRLPKKGYFTIADHRDPTPESKGHGNDRFGFSPGEIKADWANLDDVEVCAFHIWSMSRNRIKSVDAATNTVTFKAPTGYEASWDDFTKGNRYLVENVKEALSDPGEWYLDRPTGVLTYIPEPGETPENIDVEAPVSPYLVGFEGDVKSKKWVSGITLKNLNFEGGNWNLSPTGRNYPQAEADLSGEVRFSGARSCSLEKCSIRHTGEYGVDIGQGCRDVAVNQCKLEDLGAGGVKIGEQTWEHDENLLTSHCTVSDSVINGGGRMHPAAVGVWVGQNPFIQVVGNTIHDLYYTGVSVGWSWGYQANGAHDNTVSNNRISDIGQGVLSDMGGIYTLGPQAGTVLSGNRIHDVYSFSYGGWGIYPDEGSSNLSITGNCVFRCKSAGFHQHYGENNKVSNNIFALNGDSQIMRTRAEDHLSFSFDNNIVYWEKGPLLASNWTGNNYKFDHNYYWCLSGKFDFAGMGLKDWQAKGQDVHSHIQDPGFRDPMHGDFRLRQDLEGFRGFPAMSPDFEKPVKPWPRAWPD
ncbi:MAG TPA: right-handed parallel beta-helix repeat-containing protein [Fimbriimonadaceae bacterium]|jgi:parallel beta-helix repeat protein